jgi:amidohydrolase
MNKRTQGGTRLIPAELERRVLRAAAAAVPAAWDLARAIHATPELAYQEKNTSRLLREFLAARGFRISPGPKDLPTAFVAEAGDDGPCLGLLAEMDALPEMGHACGHNLIAASSAGAAAALVESFPRPPGRVVVIGCPAEESGGGKIRLAAAGVFDKLDAALVIHPDRRTEVYKRTLGVVEVDFHFHGRAAHAAAWPENGVNALDAVIQLFNAIAMLRQQMPDKQRVHGIITHGGDAPNIIPEHASARFMVRGLTVAETLGLMKKVVACARGAASATGCRLRVAKKERTMYAPYLPNRALGEAFNAALARLGIESDQGPEDEGMGSTDVGNVSQRAPTIHPLLRVPGVKESVHTAAFAAAAGGEPGRVMLERAIALNAIVGAAVLTDAGLRRAAREEFERARG